MFGKIQASPSSILVIGGGISGITAAVEAAEVGYKVYLIEKNPYLGGKVAQMHQYFPKLCSPYCGLEINFRRIKTNSNIEVFTLAEVESISGKEVDYTVTIKLNPRFVNDNCTACGQCVNACPSFRPDEYNYGLNKTKAIYLPNVMAFPTKYVIDRAACSSVECSQCASACVYNAIDLNMPSLKLIINVGAIILATGWQPYDATKLADLGFGKYQNVITNVMMERLAAADGPTQGKIVRPSDGKEVNRVAFVQCAGSRDKNYLPYCSGVCCSASLKQVTYIQEKNPEAQAFIFYIDIRLLGTMEDFYNRVQSRPNLYLIKGKVSKVQEEPTTKDLIISAEDISLGRVTREKVDMVVLATGIVPNDKRFIAPDKIAYDDYGFFVSGAPGIYAAGCAKRPADVSTSVREATGAALKAIQSIAGKNIHG